MDYVERMEKSGEWGDGVMVAAASRFYDRQIIVVVADDSIAMPTQSNSATAIYIGYASSIKHYVHLEPKLSEPSQQQQQQQQPESHPKASDTGGPKRHFMNANTS